METVIFKCRRTGMNVQHRLSEEPSSDEDGYETVQCPACAGLHFISRSTGKLVGED
jgi:hypothetical protein